LFVYKWWLDEAKIKQTPVACNCIDCRLIWDENHARFGYYYARQVSVGVLNKNIGKLFRYNVCDLEEKIPQTLARFII